MPFSYKYKLPNLSFTCPHCQTFCKHTPLPVVRDINPKKRISDIHDPYYNKEIGFLDFANLVDETTLCVVKCPKCDAFSLLASGTLVWPKPCGIPASEHMPDSVQKPYDEAQKVLHDSPWAACILLRIALERLCDHLGGTGSNLFKRIESLNLNASEKVFWTAIRKAGNASAHENAEFLSEYQERGTMNPNIAVTLSKFINLIVESHVASQAEAETIVKMLEGS